MIRSSLPLLLLLFAFGCAPPGPPPVTAAMVASAKPAWPEASSEALERGRSTLVTRCRECHPSPGVEEKSAADWPGILGTMAQRAKLNPSEHQELLHYLLAAKGH